MCCVGANHEIRNLNKDMSNQKLNDYGRGNKMAAGLKGVPVALDSLRARLENARNLGQALKYWGQESVIALIIRLVLEVISVLPSKPVIVGNVAVHATFRSTNNLNIME